MSITTLRVRCVAILATVLTAVAAVAHANEGERVGQLEDQVARLEAEVATLKQLLGDLLEERETASTAGGSSEGPAPSPSGAPPLPSLSIGGFADVEYGFASFRPDGGPDETSNRFILGDLDIFLSSQLSDRVSFLTEILFEFQDEGQNIVDVERLLLKYEPFDWLNASAGRGHTPIGYWNTAFHHGTWLYTTVDRPLLFEFEDERGILPIHFVGLELSGRAPESSIGLLYYNALVSNGRGRTPSAIQLTDDINDSKMWAVRVGFEPEIVPGLSLGGSVLGDQIPSNPAAGWQDSLDELIAGGYLVYRQDPFELLVEGQAIRHDGGGGVFHSWGGYAQVAYGFGRLKPYYRFDILDIDPADPFFALQPEAQDTDQHTVGIRWDWTTFAALKLEYRRRLSRTFDSDIGVGQLSLTF